MDLLSTYNDGTDDDEDDCEIIDESQTHTAKADTDQRSNTDSPPQHQEQLGALNVRSKTDDSNVVSKFDSSSIQVKQTAAFCNVIPLMQSKNPNTTVVTLFTSSAQEILSNGAELRTAYEASLPASLLASLSSRDEVAATQGSSVLDYFNLCSDSIDTSDDNGAVNLDDSIVMGSVQRQQNVKACCGSSLVNFWNTVSPACNWDQCERLWGVPGDIVESSSVSNTQSSTADDQYKRRKLMKDHNPSDNYESASVKLKPCFVLHHKIAPHLQNARMNKLICRHPKKVIAVLPGHAGTVNRINWCTAEYGHLLLSASMDSTVRIWNVFSSSSDSCVRTLRCHVKAVKDAVWIESGKQIISCGYDKTARISDVEHGSEISVCQHQDFVSCVKSYPVDNNLFVTGFSDRLFGWDRRSPSKPIRNFKYKDRIGLVHDICFMSNGTQFLSCADLISRDSADRNIMVWDFGSGAVLSNQIFHERYTCTRLCVHPTRDLFLAQTQGNYIAEFSSAYPYKINKCKRFEGHKVAGYTVGCDVSPDGTMVVSGSADGQLFVYDHTSARTLCKLPTSQINDIILDVACNPVLFSMVAAGTWRGDIVLWQ